VKGGKRFAGLLYKSSGTLAALYMRRHAREEDAISRVELAERR
jgi:hypothetical protein